MNISTVLAGALALLMALPAFGGAASTQEKNKELVRNFYEAVFVKHKTKAAAEKYLAPDYIQHNPSVEDGRQPFVDFFVPYFARHPAAHSAIKRILADGDLVALHVFGKSSEADKGRAGVDIFRVKDGMIVEHWDVIQEMPEKSANGHPMF